MAWGIEEAKVVREMIFKEGEFTHHRITALATLNGLLFAALGFAWQGGRELVLILAALGIGIAVLLFFSLRWAQLAYQRLLDEWDQKKDQNYDGPDVIGYRPQGPSPWVMLSMLLGLAWAVVAALELLGLRHP
jgi:hypothetical protein